MNLREAIATQPMRAFQIRVLVICLVLGFVDGFEVLVAAFTATGVAAAFGIGPVETGFFLSAGTFGMGVGAAAISPLADRIGRRNHILLCLVFICVGMAGSALAPSFTLLVIARAFAGLWIGALIPSINILVSEYCSDARRGTVMGIYGIGFPGGAAMGGFISTYLVQAWGWRAPFWFGFTLTFLLLLGSLVWLPESIHYLVEKRPAGALEAYNKIGAKLGYPSESELPPAHVRTGSGSVVLPAIFRGIMGRRTLFLWSGYASLAAAFYFANNWTPRLVTSYLTTKVRQGSPEAATWSDPVTVEPDAIAKLAQEQPGQWDTGATYVQQMSDTAAQALGNNAGVLVAVGGVVGALVFAYLASRFHPRLVTSWVLFFGLLTYLLYASFFKNPTLALVLALGVGMAANGGIAAFYAISPPVYPTIARGTGVGWMIGSGRIVSIIAPIASGYLLDAGMSAATLYQIFGGFMALSGVFVLLLHRTYASDSEAMTETIPVAAH